MKFIVLENLFGSLFKKLFPKTLLNFVVFKTKIQKPLKDVLLLNFTFQN